LRPLKQPTLRVRQTVKLPLQKVSTEQLAKARPLLLDAREGKKVEFFDLVNAYKAIMLRRTRPGHQASSPFKTTLVIELANAVETIYVPTRAAYAGGSYEVTNSTVEAGSGEMLVEAALRLLREIAREQVEAGKR
jgi:hypothetical protein